MGGIKRNLRKLYDVYIRQDQKRIAFFRYMGAGGESLRTDYPIGKEAIVIDVGGYLGDFSAKILDRFNCRVDVFEPVQRYAEKIGERFSSNSKVHVTQAGMGASEREEVINIAGPGSSVFDVGADEGGKEKIKIISAVDYLRERAYPAIDLLKINIEGGEYELLNALLEHPDLIEEIRFLQIQFHNFVPDAKEMRSGIQKKLSRTHRLMWDFPFIWESWERLND
ncbi:MAG TPA: FkbM family methyltransferase [Gammaproteobacteria bacterium]|nr:FkbM family methyltransferase [Gammaproteobacteria bacterium]